MSRAALTLITISIVLLAASAAAQAPFLRDTQVLFAADGATDIWLSKGWVLAYHQSSSRIEAIETGARGARRAFLETRPLVGNHRMPSAAARLSHGFLVAGTLRADDGALSHGFLVLDDEGDILEVHDTGLFKAGDGGSLSHPSFRIIHATELADGNVAFFWFGRRDGPDGQLSLGVTLYDHDWTPARDLYGPIPMGSFLRGAISFKDSLSQVRAAGDRLFILDAFNQRLVIANEAGDHQLSLDITDPSGLPTAIVGWSLGPSGRHVRILFVTQEQSTGEQPEYTFHHAVYDTKGHVTSRKVIPAMPEQFRGLWPTDSGHGVLALGNRMVRGRMLD